MMPNQLGSKKIALLVSIYYDHLTDKIVEYINRIPYKCDIYISCGFEKDFELFQQNCNKSHNLIKVPYPEGGADLHPFINQLEKIKSEGKTYDYYLKIHSKKSLNWAKSMFESVLPYSNYENLFKNIDKYNVSGSDIYLFNFSNSHANKDLLIQKINQFGLQISKNDVWDQIKSGHSNELDVDFYIDYHNDLRVHSLNKKNCNLLNKEGHAKHWKHHGCFEHSRIANASRITGPANKKFKFYAGTVFWFNQTYLNYLLENLDSFEFLKKKLSFEVGYVSNEDPTFTHHLEYWFGLLSSNLVYPKILKGFTTITFLVPPLVEDSPRSGGLRTVFRMIGYLQKNNFHINIEICGHCNTTTEKQKERIDLYNEIDDIDSIPLYFEDQKTFADIYVATGWQTFLKLNEYQSKNRLTSFFCQDLEFNFEIVQCDQEREKYTRDFYKSIIPTFTMSKFLATSFQDGRKLASTSLNVDTDIFHLDGTSKNGICLLYDSSKRHRLPQLILKLAVALAEKYPKKKIFLYGDDQMFKLNSKDLKNVFCLGALKPQETAELYKQCELGIIFSTTNPSRVSYEMVACGTPAIEADCEFTKYDMDSDAFIRLNTDLGTIMNKIEELFNNSNEMKRLRGECEIYSKSNFFKNAEEQRFLDFLKNEVMEK